MSKKDFITKIISGFESPNTPKKRKFDKFALLKYSYDSDSEDYYNPEDINIGDYIQSLAAKQYLTDDDKLILVDRDKTRYYDGEPVDIIANSWYWIFEGNKVFSENLNPLFVSFHINNLKNVTAETLNYLKKYEPIGCRDCTTRNFLILHGIKAYFSSCLTTTLDIKYKVPDSERNNTIIFCDYEMNDKKPNRIDKKLTKILDNYENFIIDKTTHVYDFGMTDDECFNKAEELLNKYAKAKLVVTTRIHCALPCLALGTPVILILNKYDKYRYNGIAQLLNIIGYNKHKLFISNFKTDANGFIVNKTCYKKYADRLKSIVKEFVN